MVLNEIFERDVSRPIEGVIKADDINSLLQEVDEYVLTREVEKHLGHFLDAYNQYENANGVWISGFFGSGKSHLLKMLAILLENRPVDGHSALDFFLQKCTHNEILSGDLKRACRTPSESILFNIDQKADVISKTQLDALLSVFVKVFDEKCGYYGKHAFVAQFERDLDSEQKLQEFHAAFQAIAGQTWDFGRMRVNRFSNEIDKAYTAVTGQTISDIMEKYRSDYRLSIEDFAQQVKSYIDSKGPSFRLNFFVDEVGQYVADHTKLMTNLQTIAESLNTKCQGRSWIIVTAQNDMNTVIGELGKQQSNDFSKIQARFANRINLTSQDVANVIQERLLKKNSQGVQQLNSLYHEYHGNFKTLFDFADGSQSYKNFEDRDHFVRSYPFIPYQYQLFQDAIRALSDHNAFEGKHSSVGERSLLGVFRQVAIHIKENEVGRLATFDQMFEGIRSALKSKTQYAILKAENHLQNPYAVRVLKTLFLVKYVKEFKASVRNVCILMQEGFSSSVQGLKTQVEEALALLEQETYIQRNGDYYEFLTDEEKDVEQEIKNTEVETTDVSDELANILFEQILRERKIKYDPNGQFFAYTRMLDDRMVGTKPNELCIHIISPFHEYCENITTLKSHALSKPELTVVLPADDRIYRDIVLYKKTEKYVRMNQGTAKQELVARILVEKAQQNRRRLEDLQQRLTMQMGRATILVCGEELQFSTEDANTRVIKGFYELIHRIYPYLKMLGSKPWNEADILSILKESGVTQFGNDVIALSEAEQEVLSFLQKNKTQGNRTTLKALIENFEKRPYGWYYAGILCIVAKLCSRGRIDAKKDSRTLEDKELAASLRNTQDQSTLLLEPLTEFTASQIRSVREFYEGFFPHKKGANEAKALAHEISTSLAELLKELEEAQRIYGRYPCIKKLAPAADRLRLLVGKPYTFYMNDLLSQEDELFELKQKVMDPILQFLQSANRQVYDDALNFQTRNEANLHYLPSSEVQELQATLRDPDSYKGAQLVALKKIVQTLQEGLQGKLKEAVAQSKQRIAELRAQMQQTKEYAQVQTSQQQELESLFTAVLERIERQGMIPVLLDTVRHFEDSEMPRIIGLLQQWTRPVPVVTPGKPAEPEKVIEYVPAKELKVSFKRLYLEDESEVDEYLGALRSAILDAVKSGKRVRI